MSHKSLRQISLKYAYSIERSPSQKVDRAGAGEASIEACRRGRCITAGRRRPHSRKTLLSLSEMPTTKAGKGIFTTSERDGEREGVRDCSGYVWEPPTMGQTDENGLSRQWEASNPKWRQTLTKL